MCKVPRIKHVFFPSFKEIVHVRTCCYKYTSPQPVSNVYGGPLILCVVYIFLYPRHLNYIKYTKYTAFSVLLVPPLSYTPFPHPS